MSRIGSQPVVVPQGVDCNIQDGMLNAKGKLGSLQLQLPVNIDVQIKDSAIQLTPKGDSQHDRAMWGTTRANINNIVVGVSEGFVKKLEINGVGYRAAMKGNDVELQLGFSHNILHKVPQGIKITCESATALTITGVDKQKVGQVAAKIRSYRPPEPYKGKGVKYADEYILRKEGKKK